MTASIFDVFPALAGLEPPARAYLLAHAQAVRLPAGAALFHPGGLCALYPLLLSGRVVVRRLARSGREIVLYRVLPGQTCVMTTTCMITAERASAEAIAETEVDAQGLAPAAFAHLLAISPTFRAFAFGACARRIGDLMARIEEIADTAIDRRLAGRLLAAADGAGVVALTHAALATDIGSAREVVSRTLKLFAAQGWVRAGRGAVHLVEIDALRRLATQGDEVTDTAGAAVSDAPPARRLEP